MGLVSVVIPAYNEEKHIANVLDIIVKTAGIEEVIVVNDGSTDNTLEIIKKFPVDYIDLKENHGKGGAMFKGAQKARGDYIFFLDADLVGLTEQHIHAMLEPIKINNSIDMVVGIFDSGRLRTDLAQIVAPFLSGQRVIKKNHLYKINNLSMSRFGVEAVLTKYAVQNKLQVKEVILKNLTHVMKEEKLGLVKGTFSRLKMYWEIAKIR